MKPNKTTPLPSWQTRLGAVLIALALSASTSIAATNINSQTDGKWNEEGTWDLNTVPGSTAAANIIGGNTVEFDSGTSSVAGLRVGNGSDGSLEVSAGSLTSTTTIHVGYNADGTLDVTGGKIATSGTASNWAIGNTGSGLGTLNISNGGEVVASNRVYIGMAGASGIVNIQNGGSLSVASNTYVGYGGTSSGTLNLYTGSTFSQTAGSFMIGTTAGTGSSGTVNMYGGELKLTATTSNLQIGYGTQGTLNATGGTITVGNEIQIGNSSLNAAGKTGELIAKNADITAKTMRIGNGGTGSADFTDSTLKVTGVMYAGSGTDVSSTLIASNSTLEASTGFVFGGGTTGDAVMTLDKGSTVEVTNGNFAIGLATGTGTATLNLDSTSSILVNGNGKLLRIRKNAIINFKVGAKGEMNGIITDGVEFAAASIGAQFMVDLSLVEAFTGTLNINLISSTQDFSDDFNLSNLDPKWENASSFINITDKAPTFFIDKIGGLNVLGISITAVPEPSTYAAVLGMLTLLALSLRGRRKS